MSNLFKYGFSGLTNISEEPFIIDANKTIKTEPKIIRPIQEKNLDDKENDSSENEPDKATKIILDDAMDTAKSIRDDAVLKAAQIVSDAKAEADAIREAAREEGYKTGYEEGSMEAMKKADEYIEGLNKEQEEFLARNNIEIENGIADTREKLIDFTCNIIEKMTGILVNDYKSVMLHMINNALNETETSRMFVIKVSESAYTYISDNYDRLVGAGNPNINIEVYGDSKLDVNQCIIETDNGIIDLSMDVQVRNLITAIKLLSSDIS